MKNIAAEITLDELFQLCSKRLNHVFNQYTKNIPALELKSAMEYTLFNGGKYLRPLLIYATGLIFNASYENLDVPAAAVEAIHTYSLIHDDLPAMDDADVRRGKPSCHQVYSEGITILTGDALHTLAVQIIASHPAPLRAERRLEMIKVLSEACGPFGMAAGQALDITVMDTPSISPELLKTIYHLKTGALFNASIELGRLASKNEDEFDKQALARFGNCIGLAFQIQDDIVDIESPTQSSGKTSGLDARHNKMTYPRLYGLKEAKEKVQELYLEALESINYLGQHAQLLRELTTHMLQR